MKFNKLYKVYIEESQKTIVYDFAMFWTHRRTNVSPPYTQEELDKIDYFSYLYIKFIQDNGMSTRHLIDKPEDLKDLRIKKKT